MTDDAELLHRYTAHGAEDAFSELVRRHIDFVYGTALRQSRGNAALAEDVTQMVFIDLAKKAAALARHPALVGWLHTATRFATARAIRGESRRQARERAAHAWETGSAGPATTPDWSQLQPLLDEALGDLKERERTAILLRFFEGRPLAEVGACLALSESAARSCLDRALDKLQARLARRGITSTGAALGVVLANQVSAAAPAGLAASVAGTALAGVAAGGGAVTLGAFIMGNIKIGIAGIIVVVGLTTAVVEVRANRALRGELNALRAGFADPGPLSRENQRLRLNLAKAARDNPDVAELARLRSRAEALKSRPPGVLDAELKPASAWRNAGRATPEAAFETFHWALFTGNLDVVAAMTVFRDDTKENRAAFMAQCSEAVRNRYQTPERVVAAGMFGVGTPEASANYDPGDSYQVLGQDEHVGGDGTRLGQVRIRTWYHRASGQEYEGGMRLQPTPDGWALGAMVLAPGAKVSESALDVLANLDPATGNFLPPKP